MVVDLSDIAKKSVFCEEDLFAVDEEIKHCEKISGLMTSCGDENYRRMTARHMHNRYYVVWLIEGARKVGDSERSNRLLGAYNAAAHYTGDERV